MLIRIMPLLLLAPPVLGVVHDLMDLGLPIAVMLFIVFRLEGRSLFLVWKGSLLLLLILQNEVGRPSFILGLVELRLRPSAQATHSRGLGLLNTVHCRLSEVLLTTCVIFEMWNRPGSGLLYRTGNLGFHDWLTSPLDYRRRWLALKFGRWLNFSQLRHSVFNIFHGDLTRVNCTAWCELPSDTFILFLNQRDWFVLYLWHAFHWWFPLRG